jgi:hypothetical protein
MAKERPLDLTLVRTWIAARKEKDLYSKRRGSPPPQLDTGQQLRGRHYLRGRPSPTQPSVWLLQVCSSSLAKQSPNLEDRSGRVRHQSNLRRPGCSSGSKRWATLAPDRYERPPECSPMGRHALGAVWLFPRGHFNNQAGRTRVWLHGSARLCSPVCKVEWLRSHLYVR